ncbi:DUF6580 family putative transport protein [Mucilaginibacter gotjawali]|uniref:Uncharacterized protein n=2 Tax=Mucilaginibacter gotjawali TaxID=1550579 RepID=A0A0X8X2J8_9SPHI|nr:DUF6580 family putative transport protein [Mucilaginibacter gotjawali]MBB3055755.1 hypothetical protein [Mucilaginibacter gotjawali]BAU54576.1 hypothetical protein MgSA37_02752 [Mucilaginibacter gotjawali]
MSLQKINTRTIVLILMIVAAAAMRLLSFKFPYILSNFTPVGAIALFGGAYFTDKWKAYLVVLLTLFASDILINYLYTAKWVLWYGGSFWVYLTFAIMVFIGSLIKKANVGNIAIASLASVAVHWLIIDMPWLYGSLYPHNLVGYGQSLIAAIPFERNMVLGDIVFCAILFGGFELAQRKYTFLRIQKEPAI